MCGAAAPWIALGGALTLLPATAAAQPAPPGARLELAWSVPEACPPRAFVVDEIERLLGAPIHRALRRPLAARAEIAAEGGGFTLRLETTEAGGAWTREIEASSCGELARAAALVIALAIDPDRVAERAPADSAATAFPDEPAERSDELEPSASAASPAPLPAPPPPPPPPPRPPTVVEWSTRLALAADVGSLPNPGFGPAAALGARRGAIRVEAEGTWLPPVQGASPEAPDVTARIGLTTAALRVCYAGLRGKVEVGPCVGAEAGVQSGEGRGATVTPRRDRVPWLAPAVGGELAAVLAGGLRLRYRLEAMVPLGRSPFLIRRADGGDLEVFRPSALAVRSSVGLEIDLP